MEFSNLGQFTHNVELYTARFFVQGTISGPFKRTSDLVNFKNQSFFIVQDASITNLGQAGEPRKLSTPLIVGRSHIHLVAIAPQETPAQEQPASAHGPGTAPTTGREFFVSKTPVSCYGLTDTFIIHGTSHLLQGTTLEKFIEMGDTFVPLTNVTVYLAARPTNPWRRDLVIVNKNKLEVFYADGS